MKSERSIGKTAITETVILVTCTHKDGQLKQRKKDSNYLSILLGIGSSKKGVEDDDGFI